MEKKRYELKIADVDMAILSDEKEDFVNRIANELDSDIKDLLLHSRRSSKLDCAILVALEYASEKVKAEKRVRNLEAQVTLYDANIRRLREENARLRGDIFVCPPKKDAPVKAEADEEVDELMAIDGAEAEDMAEAPVVEKKALKAEDDAVQLSLVDAAEAKDEKANTESRDEKREDKLRQIESLLRGR